MFHLTTSKVGLLTVFVVVFIVFVGVAEEPAISGELRWFIVVPGQEVKGHGQR